MIDLLLAILLASVVGMLLRIGFLLIRLYGLRYELYREHALMFYDAADRLVENPNTPDDVIDFLGEMNGSINFPRAAMLFAAILHKNRNKPKAKTRFDLRALPQDVVADFVIAFEHWIEAMACRGMVWGLIFKAGLDSSTVEAKAKTVAAKSNAKFALAA